MNKKRVRNIILAVCYIIVGFIAVLVAEMNAITIWGATDFLQGINLHSFNWWIRKGIYFSNIAAAATGMWLAWYGCSYLFRKRR